uniref:Variant surface glycoprotein 1688 n=1 Tax=Trypanosoma brucei TaxID=5691 RepID=M4T0R3_9TRYP|nr:variant surface glycoprotein 1688 [Trypanosoma brucei]
MSVSNFGLLLLFSCYWVPSSRADETFGEAGADVKNMCGEAAFFIAAATNIEGQVRARGKLSVDLQKDVTRFKLAAHHPATASKRPWFEALALYSEIQHQKTEEQERTLRDTAQLFVTQAHRWAGKLLGVQTAAALKAVNDDTKQPAVAGNDATIPTAGTTPDPVCPNDEVKPSLTSEKKTRSKYAEETKNNARQSLAESRGKPANSTNRVLKPSASLLRSQQRFRRQPRRKRRNKDSRHRRNQKFRSKVGGTYGRSLYWWNRNDSRRDRGSAKQVSIRQLDKKYGHTDSRSAGPQLLHNKEQTHGNPACDSGNLRNTISRRRDFS